MTLSRTSFKTLLFVSLLINVFLIGGVIGGLYKWSTHPKPSDVAVNQHGLRHVLTQLPQPQRHDLRRLLRQTRLDSKPLITAGREARLDVIRQLEAANLDLPALNADLDKAREADSALRGRVDSALATFATTLNPVERQQLAKSLYIRAQDKAAATNHE